MKRVAIYCRVSTPQQATEEKTSLENQEMECRNWLNSLGGYEVVAVESDPGVSGAKLSRPGMNRLLEMAHNRQIDFVCLSKVDRLARGAQIDAILTFKLNQVGVGVLFVDRDTSTTAGKMLVGFEVMASEWERDGIRSRLSNGLQNALRMKKQFIGSGHVAYGYKYEKTTKSCELDEVEYVWARRIFEWIGYEGLSMSAVARRLNDLGIPTKRNGRGWVANSIKQIVDNPIYYGRWAFNKTRSVTPKGSIGIGLAQQDKTSHERRDEAEWLYVDVPAIISKELWDRCQQAKEKNKIQSKRNGKLDYLLRAGMLVCGQCRLTFHGTTSHEKRVYRCGGVRPYGIAKLGTRCKSSVVQADKIEEKVWNRILAQLRALTSVEELFAGESEEARRQRLSDEEDLISTVGIEAGINKEEELLVSLYMRSGVSDLLFDKKKDELDKRRKGITELRSEIEERMMQRQQIKAGEDTLKQLVESANKLQNTTFEQRRKLLEFLRTKVTVNADGSLDIDGLITDKVLDTIQRYTTYYVPFSELEIMKDSRIESIAWGIVGEPDLNYVWTSDDGSELEGIKEPITNAMDVLHNEYK